MGDTDSSKKKTSIKPKIKIGLHTKISISQTSTEMLIAKRKVCSKNYQCVKDLEVPFLKAEGFLTFDKWDLCVPKHWWFLLKWLFYVLRIKRTDICYF